MEFQERPGGYPPLGSAPRNDARTTIRSVTPEVYPQHLVPRREAYRQSSAARSYDYPQSEARKQRQLAYREL